MLAAEPDSRWRLVPHMFFFFLATGLRIELAQNVPFVHWRVEVIERTMMLTHRAEYRRDQQEPGNKREPGGVLELHAISLPRSCGLSRRREK